MNIITNNWNYIPPNHVSNGELLFKGIFAKLDCNIGCINSNCSDLTSAINRTIFDATYCSPWKPEDITVLRIDIKSPTTDDFIIEYAIDENWKSIDIKKIYG